MAVNTYTSCLDRAREVIHRTLIREWWGPDRLRPIPINSTNFKDVALLIDSTTIPIPEPRENQSEVYDGKNGIHGYKKEVAVMAASPHYALFASKKMVARKHDYNIFKSNYTTYLSYLEKTPEEMSQSPGGPQQWSVLCDNGYIGPASDTPEITRIVIPKQSQNHPLYKEMCTLRCPVERFFGRMTKLWKLSREEYRYSHAHFDKDIDNCILLTNENIKCCQLEPMEEKFLKQVQIQKLKKIVAKKVKRAGQKKRSAAIRKARIQADLQYDSEEHNYQDSYSEDDAELEEFYSSDE
jgi:hypothetical protein